MIGSKRRARSTVNVWPGYVDALSALLMLIIFMLLVYVVSQLYLSQTLSERNIELARLTEQLDDLSTLLGLERNRSGAMEQQLTASQNRNTQLEDRLNTTRKLLMQQTAEIQAKTERLASLDDSMEKKEAQTASQEALILNLSNQIVALQTQLKKIATALKLQEEQTAERESELEDVSRRLNTLLAERVNELEQYQSEFFGRLREILASNENIRVVGDRFLLPSELLFASGSAQLGQEGQQELDKLASVLLDVASAIPDDIDWILRIDGHTDIIPINTPQFPSNWELSTARAVAVVRYLAEQGVPDRRMVAAGFGQYFPVASGASPEALQKNRRIEIKLTDR